MDKLVTGYRCRRTLHWSLVIFFNILDISVSKAFVIWMVLNPDWDRGKLQRRQLFLKEMGKTSNPEKTIYPKNPSFCMGKKVCCAHFYLLVSTCFSHWCCTGKQSRMRHATSHTQWFSLLKLPGLSAVYTASPSISSCWGLSAGWRGLCCGWWEPFLVEWARQPVPP